MSYLKSCYNSNDEHFQFGPAMTCAFQLAFKFLHLSYFLTVYVYNICAIIVHISCVLDNSKLGFVVYN